MSKGLSDRILSMKVNYHFIKFMQKDMIQINKNDNNTDDWFIKDLDLKNTNIMKKPPQLIKKMYANAKRSNIKKTVVADTSQDDLKSYNKKRFKGKKY